MLFGWKSLSYKTKNCVGTEGSYGPIGGYLAKTLVVYTYLCVAMKKEREFYVGPEISYSPIGGIP